METFNQVVKEMDQAVCQLVTKVTQLLKDKHLQHLKISSLSKQKKKLEETVGRLEEELRQCSAEMK